MHRGVFATRRRRVAIFSAVAMEVTESRDVGSRAGNGETNVHVCLREWLLMFAMFTLVQLLLRLGSGPGANHYQKILRRYDSQADGAGLLQ